MIGSKWYPNQHLMYLLLLLNCETPEDSDHVSFIFIFSLCFFPALGGTACMLSHFSCVRLCIPWTIACQVLPSMRFSRQEYQSRLGEPSAAAAATAAKSLQSCLTLCDRMDGNPPGSPVPGILQARTLEWVAISFSNHLALQPHPCVPFNSLDWVHISHRSSSEKDLFVHILAVCLEAP